MKGKLLTDWHGSNKLIVPLQFECGKTDAVSHANWFWRALFAMLVASVSGTGFAQEIALACHGVVKRDQTNQSDAVTPLFIEVKIDLTAGKLVLVGFSCWAGKGDCSILKLRVAEKRISAYGDGKLTGTGFQTRIEIDRRSGFFNLYQSVDQFSGVAPAVAGLRSEDANLICQGSTQPRF